MRSHPTPTQSGHVLQASSVLALEPTSERRMAAERRLLHDDEACARKVADNALGGDPGHVLIGVMDALATFEL